jgi:hypothetical protein
MTKFAWTGRILTTSCHGVHAIAFDAAHEDSVALLANPLHQALVIANPCSTRRRSTAWRTGSGSSIIFEGGPFLDGEVSTANPGRLMVSDKGFNFFPGRGCEVNAA